MRSTERGPTSSAGVLEPREFIDKSLLGGAHSAVCARWITSRPARALPSSRYESINGRGVAHSSRVAERLAPGCSVRPGLQRWAAGLLIVGTMLRWGLRRQCQPKQFAALLWLSVLSGHRDGQDLLMPLRHYQPLPPPGYNSGRKRGPDVCWNPSPV